LLLFFHAKSRNLYTNSPLSLKDFKHKPLQWGKHIQINFGLISKLKKTTINNYGGWDIGFSCQDEPSVVICGGKNTNFAVAEFENVNFKDIDASFLTGCKMEI
jgi:hypothetical protein